MAQRRTDLSADISVSHGPGARVLAVRCLDSAVERDVRGHMTLADLLFAFDVSEASGWVAEQLPAGVVEPADIVLARDELFRVVSLEPVGERTARLDIRAVAAHLLPALVDARAAAVGQAKGLSAREIDVLRSLVAGRSIIDIAGALRIKPRTVKFHQANILAKLDADSRFDLLRVVL